MSKSSPLPDHSPREIFLAALDLPADERAAFAEKTCGGDSALIAKVNLLLRHHREDSFLETSAVPPPSLAAAVSFQPGTMIGCYKLIEKLGEGGCGTVFRAEQIEPVRREVALKVIKLGMDTRAVVARFEAERQALALMDHPNIAKVFEAGVTENGRPYFVMELVRGERITDFCDQQNLSTPRRLELFMQVCRAAQHAHQKGIIHRDLKPSNVLVALHDGVAVPKVIDFGIAKATAGEPLTDKTFFTAIDQFIGTPAYMSPEQADTRRDIDTRSDIYSLGVLLYELLTGVTPFGAEALRQAGLEAMCRVIREQEPPRPSTRLQTLPHAELDTTAARRAAAAPQLIQLLRGDLDWIVLKALEKDRARRFETAAALADDIQRHLRHEPVLARPPSKRYQLQKFARRHRLAFAASTVMVLALVAGLAVASWGLWREYHARARSEKSEQTAKAASKKSEQVSIILRNLLVGVTPEIARGRDATVLREMVNLAAENVERDTRSQPEVEADVRNILGEIYDSIGEFAKAEAELRRALSLRKELLGETDLKVAETLHLLGGSLYHQSKADEAEPLFRQALTIRRSQLGPTNALVPLSMNNLALALRMQNATNNEAETLQQEALALQEKIQGTNDLDLAISWHNQATSLYAQRNYPEAESVERRALTVFRQIFGEKHPAIASALHGLASIIEKQPDRMAEAETQFRDTLRLKRELYPSDHAEIGVTVRNLALLLRRAGQLVEAETLFREALTTARRGGVFTPQDLERCLSDAGSVIVDRAWLDHESTPPNVQSNSNLIARALEAEALLRESLTLHAKSTGTNYAFMANLRSHMASCLTLVTALESPSAPARDQASTTAETLLLAANAQLQPSPSIGPDLKRKTLRHLGRLYQAWQKPDQAAEWLAKYQAGATNLPAKK